MFDKLKKSLANLPLLTKPIPGEPLILYISVGPVEVSSVLLREEIDNKNLSTMSVDSFIEPSIIMPNWKRVSGH